MPAATLVFGTEVVFFRRNQPWGAGSVAGCSFTDASSSILSVSASSECVFDKRTGVALDARADAAWPLGVTGVADL